MYHHYWNDKLKAEILYQKEYQKINRNWYNRDAKRINITKKMSSQLNKRYFIDNGQKVNERATATQKMGKKLICRISIADSQSLLTKLLIKINKYKVQMLILSAIK